MKKNRFRYRLFLAMGCKDAVAIADSKIMISDMEAVAASEPKAKIDLGMPNETSQPKLKLLKPVIYVLKPMI